MQSWSPSGLKSVPHLQWGSHLGHFFRTGQELRDVLVPYFKAGLENNERCLWVTGEAFDAGQARSALRAAVPDLDKRERDKQIEIVDGAQWYGAHEQLLQREQEALKRGHAGLRIGFLDHEAPLDEAVRGRRVICLCSFCIGRLGDGGQLEVMGRHDLVLPSASRAPARPRPRSDEHALRQELERQKRTFDLAMTASEMGTWRYTIADNICVYDENAQRLYGLTEARFLHDEAGVQAKFHPDDLEAMWARVAQALDPAGDGRYDAEYRVKQPDGSWRWLSAWGLVEFEGEPGGEGAAKKPVAIVGASRDLTALKQAEELQRLLLNELNHRVKNTLATVQAITVLSLNDARDMSTAREALDRRIRSMARAHDLLTSRSWVGAGVTDVVTRALDAFTPDQVKISGDAIDLPPKQALTLSLALHELATNAVKYGALSRREGRVSVAWDVAEGMLRLDWQESGGPAVAPPSRKGFGTRLLEDLVRGDLGGHARLDYAPGGLRYSITVPHETMH